MKQTVENVKRWWRHVCQEWKRNQDRRRLARLWAEASRRIQVREYDGALWICYDGAPLLEKDDVTAGLPPTVMAMRQAWVKYEHNGTALPDVTA